MNSANNLQIYPRHKFSVDDYYKMAEVGILNEDSRVELIEGEILQMVPIGSKHASMVDKLARVPGKKVPDNYVVRIQNPLRLPNNTEPEPDVMLLKPRADEYSDSHPTAHDVLLLIEVSDSTLDYDRKVKLPLYARYHIPDVWIIDLNSQHLEQYSHPTGDSYVDFDLLDSRHTVVLPTLPDATIKLMDLFGLKK